MQSKSDDQRDQSRQLSNDNLGARLQSKPIDSRHKGERSDAYQASLLKSADALAREHDRKHGHED